MHSSERLIEPPSRSGFAGMVLIITTAVLFSVIPFSLSVSPWILAPAVALCIAAVFLKEPEALSFSLFTALLAFASLLIPPPATWPYRLLIPVILYLSLSLSIRRFRSSLSWLRAGRLGPDIVLLIIGTAVISGAGLYLWHRLLQPDLSIHLAHIPAMPYWLFPLAGLGFSLGNAAMEEFVFRGVAMQALESAMGPGRAAILIQAWLFGAMHYLRGFPNGWVGFAMACIYGIMLGTIRHRARGMLAPWLAHVCADMAIFAILAAIVLGE